MSRPVTRYRQDDVINVGPPHGALVLGDCARSVVIYKRHRIGLFAVEGHLPCQAKAMHHVDSGCLHHLTHLLRGRALPNMAYQQVFSSHLMIPGAVYGNHFYTELNALSYIPGWREEPKRSISLTLLAPHRPVTPDLDLQGNHFSDINMASMR